MPMSPNNGFVNPGACVGQKAATQMNNIIVEYIVWGIGK